MLVIPPNPLYFPHPYNVDEHGIVAIGGKPDPNTLILSYSAGIFPWSNENDPLLWWYTYPRLILYPQAVKVSKSMKQVINKGRYHCTMNKAFDQVITACQQIPREGQEGTWLFDTLKESMITLHELGYAHSVEVWEGETLVGGLYGISIGKIFCGESMFTSQSNTSKLALIHLCKTLEELDFTLIDCQQQTDHLTSMGAESIGGGEYLDFIRKNAFESRLYLKEKLSSV